MKEIFLTGGTGVFGDYLVRNLADHNDIRLHLLIRGASEKEARERVAAQGTLPAHVQVHAGDLLMPHLGLLPEAYAALQSSITHVLHAAASIRFNSPLEEATRNNVATTEEIIAFARGCKKLERFGYISTALVAGKRTGTILEDEFEHNAGFNNTYQATKYQAEKTARSAGLPLVVFRPPLIYTPNGTSTAGLTSFMKILITMIASGKLPYVLGSEDSAMDVVSGEQSAAIICELFLKDRLTHSTFHITNGKTNLTAGLFHRIIEEEQGHPVPVEFCGIGESGISCLHDKLRARPELLPLYNKTESFLAEPAFPKIFDNAHTLVELHKESLGEDPVFILRKIVHEALCS